MSFLSLRSVGFLSHSQDESRRQMKVVLDAAAVCSQFLGHLVWPLTLDTSANIWLLPLSILLISLRSWENFVARTSASGEFETFVHVSSRRCGKYCVAKMKNSSHFQLTSSFSPMLRRISTIHVTKFTCSYRRWKFSRLCAVRCCSPMSVTTSFSQHFRII